MCKILAVLIAILRKMNAESLDIYVRTCYIQHNKMPIFFETRDADDSRAGTIL